MRKCVELAQRAMGCTSPNPMVGCVIVKDGKIVGQGFHPKAGQPHAEVFALRDAGELAENATAYVNLEPCNHYGRTPSCTEALINAKEKRVVVGMVDPNPIVSSSGISHLKDAGIDVTVEYDAIILSSSLADELSSISWQEESDVLIQPIQIVVASNAQHSPPILASSNTGTKDVLFTKNELVADSGTSYGGVEFVVLEDINLDSILVTVMAVDYSVLLDLRGNIKDLEVLFRDGFEQRLLQKIVVEVLPEWCARDER
ncbi:hypothetical protein IGI04_012941 [Brassica rapa subsp. trilocularis]|uniref:diaminohydroxyphosphoribosylaminopyrimidine deaminase n=1 Tax=Brassica rapa subsp. trilocularis TaxID=1813537 RepID=A0ABQ7N7F2_BRACM|nr:hypothetical protein IGI04_012941 [Brassica rapa subsp. trilocularis]